jgi:hypothetical protein
MYHTGKNAELADIPIFHSISTGTVVPTYTLVQEAIIMIDEETSN